MKNGANALEEAFCRAYTCAEAIDRFLPNNLVALSETGTYALTGEAKITVAIDREREVAWCNDSDTPRNAFNLVRHYRFGELDANSKEGTAPKSLPSYKAMLKLCRDDAGVRKSFIHGISKPEVCGSQDWDLQLTLNDKNQIEKTGQNIKLILLNDPCLSKIRLIKLLNVVLVYTSTDYRERSKVL